MPRESSRPPRSVDPPPGAGPPRAADPPHVAGPPHVADRARSEVASRLHSAAIRLLRRARPADLESGLSAARLSALSVVVFGGPVSLGELAEAEQVTSPTMSRLVSGLEEEGLVRRRPDPNDGRAVRIAATRKGRRVLEEGRARRVRLVAAALEGLDEEGLATLSRAAAILERALAP